MTTTHRPRAFLALALLLSLALAACGGSSSTTGDTVGDGVSHDGADDVLTDTTKPDGGDVKPGEVDALDVLEVLDLCCAPDDAGSEPASEVEPVPEVEPALDVGDAKLDGAPEVDAGCTVNGCDEGVCDPSSGLCVGCLTALDCPGESDACHEQNCGTACHGADECRGTLACRNPGASGECGQCRVADECRPDEACLPNGTCGSCETPGADCSGMLCLDGACQECATGTDNNACAAAYPPTLGEAVGCNESGRCSSSCTTWTDCLAFGALCVGSACVPCTTSGECVAQGYMDATCVGDVCYTGRCFSDAACPAEAPICGQPSGKCRECDTNTECTAALGQGGICLASGRCVTGGCGGVDAVPCSGGMVCKDNTCSTCATNAECAPSLCIDGVCDQAAICNGEKPCADSRVCTAAHACVDCSADDQTYCTNAGLHCRVETSTCVACTDSSQCGGGKVCDTAQFVCRDCQDGDCAEGQVCVDGGCVTGDCTVPGDACDTNRVCGADRWCRACADLADCLAAFGVDHVCDLGVCVPGTCAQQADCTASGTLCADHACVPCTSLAQPDATCVSAYGSDLAGHAWLCDDTVCIPGDCHDQSGCAATKTLCAPDHFCTACDAAIFGATPANHDEACQQAWGATRVCEPDPSGAEGVGACEPGCDAPDACTQADLDAGTACAVNQVCGADHRWRDCGTDAECVAATELDHAICEPFGRDAAERCTEGCTSSAGCAAAGQVCDLDDHRCRPCTTNAECGDYPGEYLCVDGVCDGAAICNGEKACADGRVCTAGHACVDCSATDATYCGTNKVCDVAAQACVACTATDDHVCTDAGTVCRVETQACVACLTDTDCSGGARLCEAFACRDCLPGECAVGHVCVGGGCVAGDKACADVGAACDDDGDGAVDDVCGTDHFCRACQADGECVTASGDANSVCEGGACASGCTPGAHDTSGKICGDDHRWRACDTDTECSTSYANSARICKTGACTLGCPDVACTTPPVCGTDHRCTTCDKVGATDAEHDQACKPLLGPYAICQGLTCTDGCLPGAFCTAQQATQGLCVVGQLCRTDWRWGACTEDAQCATAYGNEAKICAANGLCTNGCPMVACGVSSQVCGADHRCVSCTTVGFTIEAHDQACKSEPGNASHYICDPVTQACEPGCKPSGSACFDNPGGLSWICGADNRCSACTPGPAGDAACRTANGDSYSICKADGTCGIECKPGVIACPNRQVCGETYHCRACLWNPETADVDHEDDLCTQTFGSSSKPYLCDQTGCRQGECRSSESCSNPLTPVCVSNFCVSCTVSATNPQGDCPEEHVCEADGRCYPGECKSTAWCQAHVNALSQCIDHVCQGCTEDANCAVKYEAYPCLDRTGSCDLATATCKKPEELAVVTGCFLAKNPASPAAKECVGVGEYHPQPDRYPCLSCDPTRPKVWTAGEDGAGNRYCFIDLVRDPRQPDPTDPAVTGSMPWTPGRCIPEADLADAPTTWPRPETADPVAGAVVDPCFTCRWLPNDFESHYRWSYVPEDGTWLPPGDDYSLLDLRVDCDRPLFSPWGDSDPAASAAWSGSAWGTCWQGECRGLSWTPWLPLGPAGAVHTALDAVSKGGSTYDLTGSFGGGFGSGVPRPNPGCYGVACP